LVYLQPQPDDTIPRFAYETHLAALQSTPYSKMYLPCVG